MDKAFSDAVSEYWVGKKNNGFFACPNVSLFRFLGHLKINYNQKNVLEIGFGANEGADLLEIKRRGATAFGADLNPVFVTEFKELPKDKLAVFRAGQDQIPFDESFKLIYSRDTLSYFTNAELENFFEDCHRCLNEEGFLVVQFIETDLTLNEGLEGKNFSSDFLKEARQLPIFTHENPIRFLKPQDISQMAKDKNLEFVGSKIMAQSFGIEESTFRIDRYMAFQKPIK